MTLASQASFEKYAQKSRGKEFLNMMKLLFCGESWKLRSTISIPNCATCKAIDRANSGSAQKSSSAAAEYKGPMSHSSRRVWPMDTPFCSHTLEALASHIPTFATRSRGRLLSVLFVPVTLGFRSGSRSGVRNLMMNVPSHPDICLFGMSQKSLRNAESRTVFGDQGRSLVRQHQLVSTNLKELAHP
jgi:hypothetical protein